MGLISEFKQNSSPSRSDKVLERKLILLVGKIDLVFLVQELPYKI